MLYSYELMRKIQHSYTHVPWQISKSELAQLLPDTWVTNYEKITSHGK